MSLPTSQPPPAPSEHNTTITACFHCGETVPRGANYDIDISGQSRAMCCPGCRAVASLIAGGGMASFYEQRTAFSVRPPPDTAERENAGVERYKIYDDSELAATFTEQLESGNCRARLLLGGMTCAACTWLIEQSLMALPGVKVASVHLSQSRVDIEFCCAETPLSEIFAHIEALGYKARPFQTSAQREQMSSEYKTGLKRLAVAGLGMMQVGMFAIALHAGDIQGIEYQYQALLRWVSLLVSSFIVLYSARPFFTTAWRHLRVGALVMDLPVALAIGLAWLASAWATATGSGQVYFDSVVMFTFFLLLARFLELRVRQRNASSWYEIEESLPSLVLVRRDDQWHSILRQKVEAGDTVLLKPGETIAVDAQLLKGNSAVEESAFNGEELPRAVHCGDIVYAGTVNMEASMEARVLGSYRDTRLALLQRSIVQGEADKPALTKLADRVASRFVAAVLIITSLTAIAWYYIDPQQALWISLSVLVISCPCALSLATPAALTAAANALRSAGVIVRGENALESLSRISHLVFDKTGTLTEGKLGIVKVVCLDEVIEADILGLSAALQHYSNHPLAQAFDKVATNISFDRVHYQIGAGLTGYLGADNYTLGSETFCRAQAPSLPPPPKESLYWIALCKADTPLAWIGLNDKPRVEAEKVVDKAKACGLSVELLTGDSSEQGPALAILLGIDVVNRGMAPEQKMEYVKQLQSRGAIVAMVGDGLNDAPVLSVANTSFAVAGATDLARTRADFLIVDHDLHAVTNTWKKARQCRRIIKQNFAWALSYNFFAIPLAALGFVPPWAAAIGMSLSSLLVVLNSLRLSR
ncbi:MAG: heavy metal translocating P-type ATPase [Proteobacteria bacterium]|nr:heavy metal translocating P-type ATPase [Pseudomonadota bacterium]